MTVEDQRQQLEQELGRHSQRADRITAEIRTLNNELTVHNVLLALGRDEQLLALLGRLREDESLAREAADGGRAFFERHGVELPPELRSVTGSSTDDVTELRGLFLDESGDEHEAVWNSGSGFSLFPAYRGDKSPSTNPDVTYSATRTMTGTDFRITGSGFTPGGIVRVYILFKPGTTADNVHIGTLTAKPDGSFYHPYTAHYLPGDDPGTRAPAFVANDATTDESGMEEVPSAYWYA
ncbi:hypothetical protein O3S80_12085 [Streptomyces sp. Lzd4kr]|nr:hypothetical protein [Streptomyces sp. Lzd4kr]